jgi:hypothetical protein
MLSLKNAICGALERHNRYAQIGYEQNRHLLSYLDSSFAEIRFEWEQNMVVDQTAEDLKKWLEEHNKKSLKNRSNG